jgi:hypothetical protein
MMLAKKEILIGIVSAAVAALLIFCVCHKSERRYEGKTLSQWVDQYGQEYPKAVAAGEPVDRTEAANAIRQIGTNAIPRLITFMLYDPPPLVTRWWASKSGIFRPLKARTYEHYKKKFATASAAEQSLTLFLREQAQIVPALSNVVLNETRNPDGLDLSWWPPGAVGRSVDLMQHMYPLGTRALGVLLTNSTTPTAARIYLADCRFAQFPMKNNPEVMMAIKAGLSSGDPELRSLASNLLIKAGPNKNRNR